MKKIVFFVLLLSFLFILPIISALNIKVDKVDEGSVIIAEINNPAVFNFVITNYDSPDTVEIYSLLPVSMSPVGAFDLPSGTSNVEVKVYPSSEIRKIPGFYNFEYQIKGSGTDVFKDTLRIKIVPLEEAISVTAGNFKPGDKSVTLNVKNLENTNLDNVSIEFSSAFFDYIHPVSLKPYGQQDVVVSLDQDKMVSTNAGAYIFKADVSMAGAKTEVQGTMNYLEKEGLAVKENSSGIIIRENTISKTNVGNVPTSAKIEVSKDIISRLFTVYSLEPGSSNRQGLSVVYSWEKSLKPGESFEVSYTTNYTFPFILLIVIVVVILIVRRYYVTHITLNKRVSFVKTRGGEFALKVNLSVRARKSVDNVQIIDRLPGSTQLYEKFGVKPDKIDAATRRLIWTMPKLNAGEERVFSYIIYSKLKIVGRFELPPATAIFEKDDKTHEVFSNKTFFMNETIQRLE